MSLLNNNELQFVTLPYIKKHFKITDSQDDDTLLGIVQASNLEVKKRIIAVTDDLSTIEGSIFFQPCQDAARTYCESEIRRQISLMFTEAETIMTTFNSMMDTLIGEIRSQAPDRTSRKIAARDTDFEDDYFAERRLP